MVLKFSCFLAGCLLLNLSISAGVDKSPAPVAVQDINKKKQAQEPV